MIKNGGNATQAAISAGAPPKGAATTAMRWLKRADVSAALLAHTTKIQKKTDSLAARLVEEIAGQALFNPQEMLDSNGDMLPLHKMPEHVARAIASIEETPAGRKYKMVSKLGSQELVSKILQLVKQDQQQQAIVIQIRQAPDTVGQQAISPGSAPLQIEPEW
jgi:phage terminase small subunit